MLALVAVAGLGGCGGGGGGTSATSQVRKPPPVTQSAPSTTPATTGAPAPKPPPSHGQTVTTPDQTGGSEPARSEVTIEVSRLGVSTPEVTVAPFVAVRLKVVSSDGSTHVARVGGRSARVDSANRTATLTLPGLPAGQSYSVAVDRFKPVRVVSSGEPGP